MNYDGKEPYKRATGAFYTPKFACDLAVDRISQVLGKEAFKQLCFYDPAAGEGNLLDALPKGTHCIASTLEKDDVPILYSKGYDAFQFDFLNDDISTIIPLLPDNLVVLMNPPYFVAKKESTKAGRMYGTGDSVQLFYYRIFKEVKPLFVFSFNKLDLLSSPIGANIRRDLLLSERIIGRPFLTNSKDWGLKGSFPIGFFGYQISYKNMKENKLQLVTFEHAMKLDEIGFDWRTEDMYATDICAYLAKKLNGGKGDKLDVLRKRAMAAIGGYLKVIHRDSSAEIIKGIACRSTGYAAFNKIPAERLRNLYSTFRNKQKDIDSVDGIASGLLEQSLVVQKTIAS